MKNKTIHFISNKKIIIITLISIFLLITVFCSFQTIKSGEVGLRVRFGKIIDSNLSEGFNFKIPYIEKIVKVNIKVQKVELTTAAASKDLQDINTNLAINYRVLSEEASNLYKTVGNAYEEIILVPVIEESLKAIIQLRKQLLNEVKYQVNV